MHRITRSPRLVSFALIAAFGIVAALFGSAQTDAQTAPPDRPIGVAPFNDFTIEAIEVSQGVQDLDNTMPLVAGRWTVVRVYVRDIGQLGHDKVTARLRAERVTEGGGINQILAQPIQLAPGALIPSNPGATIAVGETIGDRRDLNDAFWFFIPSAWHAAGGEIRFTAEVNPELDQGNLGGFAIGPQNLTVNEANRANNTASVEVNFHRVDPVRIRYVPLHLHDDWDWSKPTVIYNCGDSGFWEITWVSLRFLPTNGVVVNCAGSPLEPLPHNAPTTELPANEFDISDPATCLLVNERLSWLKSQENLAGLWHYAGMIDPSFSGLCNGWAGAASSGTIWVRMSATGSDDPYPDVRGGRTLAHEVGHRLGSPHVLCKGNEGPPNGSIDPDYPHPFPDCRLTPVDPAGFYGLDVYWKIWDEDGDPAVLNNGDPNAIAAASPIFPLMGYQSPKWTSPYTYCGYLNELVIDAGFNCDQLNIDPADGGIGFAAAHIHPDGELHVHSPAGVTAALDPVEAALASQELDDADTVLRVTGIANIAAADGQFVRVAIEDRENVFEHVFAEAAASLNALTTADFDTGFQLQIWDAGQAVLVDRPLEPEVTFHEGVPGFSFNTTLPLPDGATTVALLLDDVVLDQRALTGSGPTVTLDNLDDGVIDAFDLLSWNGTDPDGDPLLYTVKYSPDAGRTWYVLALDTTETSYNFASLAGLPGSDSALLRVVASDGVRTARATSDLLRLPGAGPELIVTNPAPGSTVAGGDTVLFSGFGQDAEDGFLPDVAWSSDLDGDLGAGDIGLNTLRVGVHQITALVADTDGNTAATQFQLTVASQESDPGLRRVGLGTGWSLAMWTGATPIEEAVAGLGAALEAVFAFDPLTASFSQYRPSGPALLNTLDELSLGDAVWLLIDDPAGAIWSQPDFTGPRSVALTEGFNLVGWTGPTTDIPTAIADIADVVETVLLWDPDAQAFLTFSPALPPALNTASELEEKSGLWIRVSQSVVWDQPSN